MKDMVTREVARMYKDLEFSVRGDDWDKYPGFLRLPLEFSVRADDWDKYPGFLRLPLVVENTGRSGCQIHINCNVMMMDQSWDDILSLYSKTITMYAFITVVMSVASNISHIIKTNDPNVKELLQWHWGMGPSVISVLL